MSIHTFELRKSFGKGENGYLKYQEFLDRAQADCQKEGYKIFYDRSNNPGYKCHRMLKFMGLGIQVHLIANHNDYYIKFIVNLQKVLVADGLVKIINESNAQEAIEIVNWQLSSWLGDEFEINRLKLSRVDICSNIDIGSAELVSAYIRQMYRAGATKSYKVYGKKEYGKRFDKVAGFTARFRSGVAELSLYDKERQLEKIGHPSDEAHGILRAEYRILNVNTIKHKHEITLTNSDTLLWFINNSGDLLYEVLSKFIVDGASYKLSEVNRLICEQVNRKKMRNRMCRFSELVAQKHGMFSARRAMEQEDPNLDSRAYHKMIDKFENIGVNPVPLPAKKDIYDLPSLFEWL